MSTSQCRECGLQVPVRRDGRFYSHRDPDGEPCWGAVQYAQPYDVLERGSTSSSTCHPIE